MNVVIFILRLLLAFLLSPLLGTFLAIIPGSVFLAFVTEESFFQVYKSSAIFVGIWAYAAMIIGIFIITYFAIKKYKRFHYINTGMALGFVFVISEAALSFPFKLYMPIIILGTGMIAGGSIGFISYYLMGRTDQKLCKEDIEWEHLLDEYQKKRM